MTYTPDIAQKIVLFQYAVILLGQLNDNEKLKEFCFSLGKELAQDESVNIKDITTQEQINDIKLSEQQLEYINDTLNKLI